jgi:ribonuclease-3
MACAGRQQHEEEFEAALQIHFTHRALLEQALTHRSLVVEIEGVLSNERLEFLGDAVLDLIIAEELFKSHPDWPEGELTKVKASAVGERSLEKVARRWNIGRYIRISHGEDSSGGRERRALLADAVEALIGAYFLDQGLDPCREFVLREMTFILQAISRREHERDYKTELQEVFQARFQSAPSYVVTGESGPPHQRIFTIAVRFRGEVLGSGEGQSKKEAEQRAAAEALHAPMICEPAEGE